MERFFGPYAQVVGLDIRPVSQTFEEDQIAVRIGDPSNENFLNAVVGEFDIVFDDGGHIMRHVLTSFKFLYPLTSRNRHHGVATRVEFTSGKKETEGARGL